MTIETTTYGRKIRIWTSGAPFGGWWHIFVSVDSSLGFIVGRAKTELEAQTFAARCSTVAWS